VLQYLSRTINWYRSNTSSLPAAGLPSDAIYLENAKAFGAQAVKLAFQSAEAAAALVSAQAQAGGPGNDAAAQQQRRTQLLAQIGVQIEALQATIAGLADQAAKAPAGQKALLVSRRDNLQAQVELQKARQETIQKMAAFVENNDESARGLAGSIKGLAKSIPEALGSGAGAPVAAGSAPATAVPVGSGGLISDTVALFGKLSSERQIAGEIERTQHLREATESLRAPLRDAMRATLNQSQTLTGQPAVTEPGQLQAQREDFQALTERFKQLSGALLPLSQEIIVLNDSEANLDRWREALSRQSSYVFRSVLYRGLGIAVALALILALSEVWRRVTFRYVADARRRRQYLVLRRVVVGFLVAIVLTLGFISQFSSLATFAGFITAGIAVGLQAVLLSVAAYFFIIGRYGIRVGDRISIAGITGDVVDIGLVRLYLMEMAGTGPDFHPTGRIVVFSNAVLFQAATPLFKQIPGTEYAWHEVAVLLAPDGDRGAAQDKLVAGIDEVYAGYRSEIERQHADIERRIDIKIEPPRPEARLQFAEGGVELLVRYPVAMRQAADIDEDMTRKVLDLIETDPVLKAAVAGHPRIRSAVKG
jgi:small-conductance mechanosensitive channel